MGKTNIITLTSEDFTTYGFFCLKNVKHPGFKAKANWFNNYYPKGLRIKILQNEKAENLGFIEYIPIEYTFRPVTGKNFMFIHCLFIYPKKNLNRRNATQLINHCIEESRDHHMDGVCIVTSEGVWMSGKSVFIRNGFSKLSSKGRFDLSAIQFNQSPELPEFINWEKNLKGYDGWNLVYSDQCPYHEKAAIDLAETAKSKNIELKVRKLATHTEAQNAPTGFGTFSLIYNEKQIEDHYISKTRFKNILEKYTE